MTATEDFLEHHGIKGMHWGIRNKENSLRKISGDYKTSQALRKKSHSELTNKQLKTANERGNLEQNFHKLNPSRIKVGRKAVEELFATLGVGAVAYNLFKSPYGQAMMNLGKKSKFKQLKLFP